MRIASSDGAQALELIAAEATRPSTDGYLVARLVGPISAGVEAYDDHWESLQAYFEDLAENWRGWEGPKAFESLEGELRIVATSDQAGHVRLTATLQAPSGPNTWTATVQIGVEAGQLDSLSRAASSLFKGGKGAA